MLRPQAAGKVTCWHLLVLCRSLVRAWGSIRYNQSYYHGVCRIRIRACDDENRDAADWPLSILPATKVFRPFSTMYTKRSLKKKRKKSLACQSYVEVSDRPVPLTGIAASFSSAEMEVQRIPKGRKTQECWICPVNTLDSGNENKTKPSMCLLSIFTWKDMTFHLTQFLLGLGIDAISLKQRTVSLIFAEAEVQHIPRGKKTQEC